LKAYRILRSPLTAVVVALLVILAIVGFRAGSLRTEQFFIKQTPLRAQVAWYRKGAAETGPDKVLVAVNYSSQGWRGSKLRAMLGKSGEALGFTADIPELMEFSTELITAELPAGRETLDTAPAISHLPIVKSNPAAQLVAFEGNLYLLNGWGSNADGDDDEDDEPQSNISSAGVQGWRLEQNKFVEITTPEARRVSQSMERTHLGNPSLSGDAEIQKQSSGWQVCTEPLSKIGLRSGHLFC
jgi:hypothetical protein